MNPPNNEIFKVFAALLNKYEKKKRIIGIKWILKFVFKNTAQSAQFTCIAGVRCFELPITFLRFKLQLKH